MTTALTPTQHKELTRLGKQATKEHRLFLKGSNEALEHANLCGAYLQQAKDGLPHGQWLKWLETDFPDGCESTAQGYMNICRNWATVQQIPNAAGDLSIRVVLKLLAKPREPDPLKALPPDQRANCQADYREECEATGEKPTAEGLRAAVDLYQADNEHYVEPPDADSDASDPEPTETPAPTRKAADEAVATPRSPCEVFWEILEMHIDQFLKGLSKKDRAMATASLVARLEAKVEEIRSKV